MKKRHTNTAEEKSMAGKLTRMSKIKQVLRLLQEGISNRRIAEQLELYKGKVYGFSKRDVGSASLA